MFSKPVHPTVNHIGVGIQRAQTIYIGLVESGFPDFARLNDYPMTSSFFIFHLPHGFSVKIDAGTQEHMWCSISFYYQMKELKTYDGLTSFSVKHLDDLCDKITSFHNATDNFSGSIDTFDLSFHMQVCSDECDDTLFVMDDTSWKNDDAITIK